MSGHTPGPWALEEFKLPDGSTQVWSPSRFYFVGKAYDVNGDPQNAANARLIAAAPELLSIAQRWAAIDGGAWNIVRHAADRAELEADTLAIIAKATEPQP